MKDVSSKCRVRNENVRSKIEVKDMRIGVMQIG